MSSSLIVGLVGGGTVGGGVYDIVEHTHKDFFRSLGAHVQVKRIAVRNLTKQRDFSVAAHTELVGDWRLVLDDPEINTVIEVMGGITEAKEVVFGAIAKGKHVITANKALLAAYLPEIVDLLKKHPQVKLGYEAAVCGGIPIIHTLQNDYLGDQVSQILGIMNGTTNFMLTKMESGADYGQVLAEAQALGYAEADPTADVEGHDVQAKIALLAKLAFGVHVPSDQIPTKGISSVASVDFEYARLLNATIKLLGMAQLSPDGKKLSVAVSPFIVPREHPIAGTNGSTNIVNISSRNLVSSSYIGPGAGRYPTANSIVSDLVRLARGLVGPPFPVDRAMPLEPDYTSRFYIRLRIRDQLGVIRVVGEIAERHGVSIYAILQNPISDPNDIHFVVTTEPARHSQVQAFADDIEKQDFTKGPPLFFAFLL
ncbi:homoserine dehydrogenase [Nannochloropsis gaditana]|uniref:Homoserine dehydrogenase n=1 Tax=Nannochloropsis gaditana TaxID=72520 RepID=W7TUB9_9STRA|nr:homoserine dehydrogenase [Nannochloropsis gaditana]